MKGQETLIAVPLIGVKALSPVGIVRRLTLATEVDTSITGTRVKAVLGKSLRLHCPLSLSGLYCRSGLNSGFRSASSYFAYMREQAVRTYRYASHNKLVQADCQVEWVNCDWRIEGPRWDGIERGL